MQALSSSATPWIAVVGLPIILLGNVASAFSATSRPFIELINPVKTIQDKLPASFVAYWPTWVLDPHNDDNNNDKFKWEKIPDSEGYVPPTSLDELWQPQDLISPHCQMAVGLHVRDGMIRHVLPAIDLFMMVPDDDDASKAKGGKKHRNWGVCSVPRAYQWMDFGAAMAGGFNGLTMELQIRENVDTNNDNDDDSDDTDDASSKWKTIAEFDSVESSINLAIEALASTPPEELGDGSSVIHVLCDKNQVSLLSSDNDNVDEESPLQCPLWGSELRVLLLEDDSPVGALQVSVEKIAAGSESEYLPDVYKPLYKDESLRRPAFVETRKRMEQKRIEQEQKQQAEEQGN